MCGYVDDDIVFFAISFINESLFCHHSGKITMRQLIFLKSNCKIWLQLLCRLKFCQSHHWLFSVWLLFFNLIVGLHFTTAKLLLVKLLRHQIFNANREPGEKPDCSLLLISSKVYNTFYATVYTDLTWQCSENSHYFYRNGNVGRPDHGLWYNWKKLASRFRETGPPHQFPPAETTWRMSLKSI